MLHSGRLVTNFACLAVWCCAGKVYNIHKISVTQLKQTVKLWAAKSLKGANKASKRKL